MMRLSFRVCVATAAAALFGFHALAGGGHVLLHQGVVPYTITTPGSYTLVTDLSSTNTPAIVVQASDVVIDLNGYRVVNDGTIIISQAAGFHRLTVRNGRVGISGLPVWWGIFAPGMGNRFEELVVREATTAAIESGPGAIVRECSFASNPLNDPSFSVLLLGPGSLAIDNQFRDNGASGISATVLKSGAGSVIHQTSVTGTRGGTNTSLVSAGPGTVISSMRSRSQVGAATNGMVTATGPIVLSDAQISERLVLPQGGVVLESRFEGTFSATAPLRHALGPHTVVHQSSFAGSVSNASSLLAHRVTWERPPAIGAQSLVRSGVMSDDPVFMAGEGSYVADSSIRRLDMAGNRHRMDGNHFYFFTQWNSNMAANADVLWVRNYHGWDAGPYLAVTNVGHVAAPGALNPWSNRP